MKNESRKLFLMFAIFSVFAFLLVGCGTKSVKTPEKEETVKATEVGETAAAENTAENGGEAEVTSTAIDENKAETGASTGQPESLDATGNDAASPVALEGRTSAPFVPVYFDFDSSNIRPDQVAGIEANATALKDKPGATIRIEGNCDERGTSEYNMALGQRRAQSAKRYLENLGVDSSRMNTISYGEEKPINHGHDELSWSQNRRDDFVIEQ